MNAQVFKSRLCLIGFLLAVLFKFWLIWETEIIDARDDPHEYVLQILYPINGGLSYPPGMGLVGRLFHDLGVPFRLGIEAAFMFALALVIKTLFAWPWKSFFGLGLFLLVLFDPALAELFSQLYSDQVWCIETMLGFSCFIFAFSAKSKLNWKWLALSAFFLGLSTITRTVFIPLLISIVGFALAGFVLIFFKHRQQNFQRNLALFALSIWTLSLGLSIIYEGTCRYNSLRHGYFGISYIDSAEYKKFYFCLQSVGDPTGDAHFAIDENRRKLIAQAGPVSNWFIRQLEENNFYKQVGLDNFGKFEIPSGWFQWASFTATMTDGDYTTSFAIFRSIENEISEANRQGRLKVRPIIQLPDSRIPIVLKVLPEGLSKTITKLVHEPPIDSFAWKVENRRYVDPDFTSALTRRTVHESPLRESIWHFLVLVYTRLYTSVIFYFYLIALATFLTVLVFKLKRLQDLSFLARQLFTIYFIALILWYALFDASGLAVSSRYLIFNHVMMPLLIGYYLSTTARLWKNGNP